MLINHIGRKQRIENPLLRALTAEQQRIFEAQEAVSRSQLSRNQLIKLKDLAGWPGQSGRKPEQTTSFSLESHPLVEQTEFA